LGGRGGGSIRVGGGAAMLGGGLGYSSGLTIAIKSWPDTPSRYCAGVGDDTAKRSSECKAGALALGPRGPRGGELGTLCGTDVSEHSFVGASWRTVMVVVADMQTI